MNHFTIRDIENLSGIKAHTLRIWEQRYNLMTPKRRISNHRFYDNDDLKQILKISFLYHSGFKISHIAEMQGPAMTAHLSKLNAHYANEYFLNQLMEASIDFDEVKFERTIDDVFASGNIESCMVNVIYPYLTKIGLLWVTEHIIPAQEHFSSNMIMKKLMLAIDNLPPVSITNTSSTVLFTPRKEHHEIALLFLHYLLKKNGKKVVYFGANTEVEVIADYLSIRKDVTRIHFHLITNLLHINLTQYVKDLSKRFPHHQIIISGPCAKDVKSKPENVRILLSLNEILSYTRE